MNEDKLLGNRIKYLRDLQKMTQKQLADAIGISVNVLSNWENGRTKLDAEYLKPMSKALNVPVSDILNYDNQANEKTDQSKDKTDILNKIYINLDPDGILEKYYSLSEHSKDLIKNMIDFELNYLITITDFDSIKNKKKKKEIDNELLLAAHGTEGMDDDELALVREDIENLRKERENGN